jgi:hypothetical protein
VDIARWVPRTVHRYEVEVAVGMNKVAQALEHSLVMANSPVRKVNRIAQAAVAAVGRVGSLAQAAVAAGKVGTVAAAPRTTWYPSLDVPVPG